MKSKITIPKASVILIVPEAIFLLFIAFKIFPKDVTLGLSFIINTVLTFEIIRRNVSKENLSISLNSISIFILLFFIVAPVLQIADYMEGSRMVNNLPYNYEIAIYANLQISLFILTIILAYFYIPVRIPPEQFEKYSDRMKPLLLIISIFIAIVFAKNVINSILKLYVDEDQSVLASLILKKSIFMLPVAAFALYKSHNRKLSLIIIIIGLIILFLKNPISERRNAIGPLYMAIVFFFFTFLYKTNFKSFIFIFILFFFLFPLSSLITNSYLPIYDRIENAGSFISEGINSDYFTNYFNTLHYDAWSNISASIEYVSHKGFSNGEQLIGGLFFFIPRIIWPGKPIGTGHLIANDFLIPQYNLWLSNISCPIISEGYINFGIPGIILFAIALALFIKRMDYWIIDQDPLRKIFGIYFSFWLFYFMRGDFMSSFAYLCGAYIGIIIIPKTINKILTTIWT